MSGFSLLSIGILGSSVAAIVLLGATKGRLRAVLFLAINLAVLGRYVLGVRGTLVAVGFAVIGFVLVELARRGRKQAMTFGAPLLIVLFIYMQDYELLHFVLPDSMLTRIFVTVGLSFLFFKILHCLIEAASGTLGRFGPIDYFNYALNFTTFAMGPIQRFGDFRDQWDGTTRAIPPTLVAHLDAVIRILGGMIKAYVLAEWVLPYAMYPGMELDAMSRTELLVRVYAFNVYLYLNFAGYCDVVIGIGSLFGVRPPENFDLPFIARNASDFWQRQHISLTKWLTDYVFTPTFRWFLRQDSMRTRALLSANIALVVTMFVSGIWHGTTMNFLVFGLLHGLYQVVYRTWDSVLQKKWGKKKLRKFREKWWVHGLGIVITFNAVSFAFVFFQLDAKKGFELLWRIVS